MIEKQLASQEIWGGPFRNHMGGSDIPKVKAYRNESILTEDRLNKRSRVEFTTEVEPDSFHPTFAYWSGKREGVRNEDGYAKIAELGRSGSPTMTHTQAKVTITFPIQLDKD